MKPVCTSSLIKSRLILLGNMRLLSFKANIIFDTFHCLLEGILPSLMQIIISLQMNLKYGKIIHQLFLNSLLSIWGLLLSNFHYLTFENLRNNILIKNLLNCRATVSFGHFNIFSIWLWVNNHSVSLHDWAILLINVDILFFSFIHLRFLVLAELAFYIILIYLFIV